MPLLRVRDPSRSKMKRKFSGILLSCVFLLILSSIGQTQVVSPNPVSSQLSREILAGLIKKYVTEVQQYQELIARGGVPDSVIEFRLAAKVDLSGVIADTELAPILAELARMAFWIEAQIFARAPSIIRVDLTGSFGKIELLATAKESILICPDKGIFSVLPEDYLKDIVSINLGRPLPEDLSAIEIPSAEQLRDIDAIMEYVGLKPTPKGMAHVVRLSVPDTGEVITLWVLDATWDLCKVEFFSPVDGTNIVIAIKTVEPVTSLPDSIFEIDKSGLTEIPFESLVEILGLNVLSLVLTGAPVAVDLSVSPSVVHQGEKVLVVSDGIDAVDKKPDLVALIEYRSPDGS